MPRTTSLENKTALVTGASRGIGRAIALALAGKGARVGVHYCTNRSRANQTIELLEGSGHVQLQADLSNHTEVRTLFEQTVEKLGRVDVVVNNAGIYELHPIAEVPYEQWQNTWHRTIDTNLMGPANLMFLAITHMRNNGGGRIINISSRGAFRGEPDAPAYGASKAGLNALGQSLAKAAARDKIIITTVAPGFVETEMAAEMLDGEDGDSIRNQSPLGRVAKPEEVAEVVAFLATTQADYLTGTIVDLNGASYLRS